MPIGTARAARRTAADGQPQRARIMTTLVSSAYFRQPSNNPGKIDLAKKALDLAQQHKIDLLALPAGFLTVDTHSKILPTVRPIIRTAKKYGISLIVGVDLSEIRSYRAVDSGKMLEAYCLGLIPLFLVVYDATTDKTKICRQRSASGYHSRLGVVPDGVMQPRTLDICGLKVQVVFCGECYDDRLFSEEVPATAIIVGHTTMPRLIKTLKAKGRKGFSLIHAEHRVGRRGTLFCIDREVNRSQQATLHIEGENALWLEAAIWKMTEKGMIHPVQPE